MSLFEKAAELASQGRSFVTVTILASRGHAPQDPGAKALVVDTGLYAGTVGGGKLEAKAIEKSKELLKNPERNLAPLRETWNLQRDVGMSCGGEVEILFEVFHNATWDVVVFGAGHVAQATVRLFLTLSCRVICVDHRQEWLDKLPPESPRFKKVLANPIESYLTIAGISETSFYVVMTMGHGTDFPILKIILEAVDPVYIGVLGSAVKAKKIRTELIEAGVPSPRVEHLKTPIGLLENSNDPAEIAVSVVAEVLQVHHQHAESSSSRSVTP